MTVGCDREAKLRCDVDLGQSGRGVALVTCRANVVPGTEIAIKQMAPDDVTRVSGFEARTVAGAPLTVAERRDMGAGSASHRFTERLVSGTRDREIVYSYRVEPGAAIDESLHNSGGRRFGRLDDRGGLLSGRNLFLLPAWYRSLTEIEVMYRIPSGWQVVGTPSPTGTRFRATGAGRAATSIVESIVGVGQFATLEAKHGVSALRLYASTDLPEEVRRATFQIADAGFAYLDDRLGPLGHDYAVVLVPASVDGSMILIPPTAAGQGSEIASAGPVQMSDLLFSMARAYTDFPDAPLRLTRDDAWLRKALPAYYAVRAEDELKLRPRQQAWKLRARSARGSSISLEDAATASAEQEPEALAKGSFVLALAETELRASHKAPDDFDAFVKRLRAEGGRRTFFGLAQALAFPRDGSQLRALAESAAPIPKDSVVEINGAGPLVLTAAPTGNDRQDPRRRLRLLLTYDTKGMLEVCGCKARQLGGIARRETARRRALGRPGPAVLVDLGNAYAFSGNDPLLSPVERDELALALELMGHQGYAACAIGHAEMLRGPRFFQEMSGRRPLPYLNANLEFGGRPLAAPSRVSEVGGLRVGWISALDPRDYGLDHARYYEERLDGLRVSDPFAALRRAARDVRHRADLVIAIGSLSPDLVRHLVETVPEIDVVLSTAAAEAVFDGTLEFPRGPEAQVVGFHGRTLVFFGANDGRSLDEIDLSLGRDRAIAGAKVSGVMLGEEMPDDRRFRVRLSGFYNAMKDSPDLAGSAEPVARVLPALLKGARYTGAAACSRCHAEEDADWQGTPHGFAFSTLLGRHRNYAPRCVRCHVTGYGISSGYRIGDPLERLRHVQCEMCHGPGSEHVATPTPFNIVGRPPREACFECHTPEHSEMTADNFQAYYARAGHHRPASGTSGR